MKRIRRDMSNSEIGGSWEGCVCDCVSQNGVQLAMVVQCADDLVRALIQWRTVGMRCGAAGCERFLASRSEPVEGGSGRDATDPHLLVGLWSMGVRV